MRQARSALETARNAGAEQYAYSALKAAEISYELAMKQVSEENRKLPFMRKYNKIAEMLASSVQAAEGAQADSGGLNSRYIFDRWVVGPHNEYATAVARSVAEAPGSAYNPVFVYADTGLGKTHLIQAVAHAILVADPGRRVKYVTCEQFIDDFISGVSEKGRIEGFKHQYRTNDVLLIDDVQFLAGKESTQEEFFYTFNALRDAHKQIVVTADKAPKPVEPLFAPLRAVLPGSLLEETPRGARAHDGRGGSRARPRHRYCDDG